MQGLHGFLAAHGLQGLQLFLAAHGFLAEHGLDGWQPALAAHGFLAAHGLQGLQPRTRCRYPLPWGLGPAAGLGTAVGLAGTAAATEAGAKTGAADAETASPKAPIEPRPRTVGRMVDDSSLLRRVLIIGSPMVEAVRKWSRIVIPRSGY